MLTGHLNVINTFETLRNKANKTNYVKIFILLSFHLCVCLIEN